MNRPLAPSPARPLVTSTSSVDVGALRAPYSPKICRVKSSCCLGRCSSQIPAASAPAASTNAAIEMLSSPRCQRIAPAVTTIRMSQPYRLRESCWPRRTRTIERPTKCAKKRQSSPSKQRSASSGTGMFSMWRNRRPFARGPSGLQAAPAGVHAPQPVRKPVRSRPQPVCKPRQPVCKLPRGLTQ